MLLIAGVVTSPTDNGTYQISSLIPSEGTIKVPSARELKAKTKEKIVDSVKEELNSLAQSTTHLEEVNLVRVVDGDTLVVKIDEKDEKVRLIGIDTPESVASDKSRNTVWGEIASDYTKSLLKDVTKVSLQYDKEPRDKYGRILAYVYVGTEMLNMRIIEDGYAKVMTIAPNTSHARDFEAAYKAAAENKKGLFGKGWK